MKKLLTSAAILLLVATTAVAAPKSSPKNDRDIKVHGNSEHGIPTFVTGKLGRMASPQAAIGVLKANGDVFGRTFIQRAPFSVDYARGLESLAVSRPAILRSAYALSRHLEIHSQACTGRAESCPRSAGSK